MNKKALIIGVVIAVVFVGGVFAVFMMDKDANAPASDSVATTQQSTQDQTSEQSNTQSENVSTNTSNLAATIVFTDSGFSPDKTVVKKGATVTVKNDSKNPVQFSSDDHPSHRLETEMNLRVLQPGESASFIITRVGSWGYHDHIDDSMVGTLTVTE